MRLLIVEDQVMFREAICRVCERDLGHTVVGACSTGMDGISLTRDLKPDIMLLDLGLPDIDGLSVVTKLHRLNLHPRILVLSSYCDDYTLYRVEQSCIVGYIDKYVSSPAILGEAIEAVAAGRCYYSAVFQSVRERRRENPLAFTKVLTERELEILALIGLALSDEEIADRMEIAPRTVKTHREHLLHKLKIPNTPKLMRFAVDNGFTAIPVLPSLHVEEC